MSHLYKHLRVHQVFGANTDVGKTVLTTALALASASRGRQVRYLKPVSTGPLTDADDEYVKRYSNRYQSTIKHECLYRFREPVSPHLAARLENSPSSKIGAIPSDGVVNDRIARYISECAKTTSAKTDMYIETAGGVHSPSLSGISQAESYRQLRLPVLLVGDSRLGGITTTISSYESLSIRGYSVDVILLFRDDYYRNWEYLSDYFDKKDVLVVSLAHPPAKEEDLDINVARTDAYYQRLASEGEVVRVIDYLDKHHLDRIVELHSMSGRTMECIWWPFVQHGLIRGSDDVMVIDSALGDFFSTYDSQTGTSSSILSSQLDGSASWWTQTFGHGNSSLALAAARAAGRYGHVMFPQATHLPALTLAERLLKTGPGKGWASRVFFSDDGSTAMEVALKMALRAYCVRHSQDFGKADKQQLGILGLKGSYHGDTIGAMDACDAADGVYTCEWHSAKGYWFDPPSIDMRSGSAIISLPPAIANYAAYDHVELEVDSLPSAYNVKRRMNSGLAGVYQSFILDALQKMEERGSPRLAALVLEPLVMGAGGMVFVDPLFQRVLVDVVRSRSKSNLSAVAGDWRGLPVIFDEVFVGLYRAGWQTSIHTLGATPDIAVYAKMLTGGLVPLAVTLTSKPIFDAYYSDKKADALLHGHSYTAHAVGCEVANESLTMIDKIAASDAWAEMRDKWRTPLESSNGSESAMWSLWDPMFVKKVSELPDIVSVMTLGTVLAIKLSDTGGGYRSGIAENRLRTLRAPQEDASGIHFRTLGDVAYFMTSLNTSTGVLRMLERRIISALE